MSPDPHGSSVIHTGAARHERHHPLALIPDPSVSPFTVAIDELLFESKCMSCDKRKILATTIHPASNGG